MRDLAEIVGRVAELERRVYGMMRHGTVAQVDAQKGLLRLDMGLPSEGGGDKFLGPWVPYAQHAGALKAHVPPSVGQQFTLMAPGGDWRQAVAVPFTWSNDNPSPSTSQSENVLTFGDATITLKAGSLSIKVGDVTLKVSAEGVDVTGGHVKHNGKNIGDSHIHGGVMPGGSTTDVPAN